MLIEKLPLKKKLKYMLSKWQLYVFIAIPIIHTIIFKYMPIYGITLAFKDYSIRKGIMGSPWVGLKHFEAFFNSPNFWMLLQNTIILSLYGLILGFPAPILLALCFNELSNKHIKKTVQTITFAPFFISTVILVGMVLQLLALRGGFLNSFLGLFGVKPVNFIGEAKLFRMIYTLSGIWQTMGYSSILYIAALSSVDVSLYEAAILDGATRIQKIIHIDIPTIAPTIILMLILSCGSIMSVGGEKVLLLQNNLNLITSEVISTYVYKVGLVDGRYSLSTAVGVFNTVVNFILLFIVNKIAQKVSETSMW